jgi:transcriptional regulator with XRE-family HTH domain
VGDHGGVPPRSAPTSDPRLKRLGQVIRKHRLAAKITQAKLAEDASVSERYLGNIERGLASPTFLTLIDIADVLRIPAEDLVRVARSKRSR